MKRKKYVVVLAIISLIAFLAITVLPTISSIVYAAETRQELEAKLKKSQESKQAAEQKVKNLTAQKQNIKDELEQLNIQIAEVENEVNEMNAAIAENEAQISAQQEKINVYDDEFKERARTMYKHGSVSYLDVLFGANSFGDLLYKVQMVQRIINYDRDILQQMTDAKTELENKKAEKELNLEILENKQSEYNSKIALRNQKINQIDSDVEAARAQADKEDAAMADLRNQLANMSQSGQASSTSSGPSVASYGSMQWPSATSKTITSPYGSRFHPIQKRTKFHTGIDIGAASGTAVLAAESGKVIMARWNGGYGNCVVIDHGGGITTLYGHNSSIKVSVGQKVSKGQTIALVGSTGNSTGPHIHFEVLINGKYTDPMAYVR